MIEESITLSSGGITAMFSATTGALTQLSNADGWNVVARPELGSAFRLLVPLEGRRNNICEGVEQNPPRTTRDESLVTFTWEDVTSQHGGTHAIAVTQRYTISNGCLTVTTSIKNNSDRIIENVYSPILGDLRPKGFDRNPHCDTTRLRCWHVSANVAEV